MAYLKCFDKDENEITQAEADALTASGKHHRASGGNCYFFTDTEEETRTAQGVEWNAGLNDRLWDDVRKKRNKLLAETDYTQTGDSPDKTIHIDYRKKLRDLPQDYSDSPQVLLDSFYNRIHHSNPVDDGKWPTNPEE